MRRLLKLSGGTFYQIQTDIYIYLYIYIWRGLYMEGLILGILRYAFLKIFKSPPRTLTFTLSVSDNLPRLPKVEFLSAECSCSGSWALSLGCILPTSNAIIFFYQSRQFLIKFPRYYSLASLLFYCLLGFQPLFKLPRDVI